MYDELVKQLKASCYSCKLWDGYGCCLHGKCAAQTRLQAADAIEELSKPKWIPVTEQLPEPYTDVLCSWDNGEVWALRQWWADTSRYEDGEDPFEYFDDFFDEDGAYKETMKYVTHWMPLPPHPKGEM